jgi:hypothetical protein
MTRPTRTEGQPHDRLTRLCDAMTTALEAHPEYRDGDKAIIFLDSDVDQRGGLVMAGYEDDTDALAAIVHLTAVFEANGKTLRLVPLGGEG